MVCHAPGKKIKKYIAYTLSIIVMPCAPVCHELHASQRFNDLRHMFLGPEHLGTPAGTEKPSYCTLPMFHPPRNLNDVVNGLGYISDDGHGFECKNPRQAFHV
jgi:hypothetical protein